jgi:large subunit ribosomal protein L3
MLKTIIGTKVGMTQVFDKQGNAFSVTVVSAGPCVVTGIRTAEKDGYNALQLGYGDVKEKALNKAKLGYFKKNGVAPRRVLKEFRLDTVSEYKLGQEIKADVFSAGDYVDVQGVSKGKGFAGNVKRHGFAGGPSTHGQSDRQRAPGSIGSQGPQRVLRGLRMAGHLGNETSRIQCLEVFGVDPEKNLLLIVGAVPGANKGIVVVEQTVKRIKVKRKPEAEAAGKKKAAPQKKAAAPAKK